MQTIFRVQTPFTCHGKMKDQCYAFDFAPDRTLRVLAETAKVSAKAGKQTDEDRKILGDFLNFCPIISIDGSQMKPYDVNKMMSQLKKAQIEKVVQCGFEDDALYNDELLKLTDVELRDFDDLKRTIGKTKAMAKTGSIDVNQQGFTNEEYVEKEKLEKKKKKDLTPAYSALMPISLKSTPRVVSIRSMWPIAFTAVAWNRQSKSMVKWDTALPRAFGMPPSRITFSWSARLRWPAASRNAPSLASVMSA